MHTSHFDYHLPEELIAQQPAARRDGSRLLVVDRRNRSVTHREFSDLPGYLRSDDTLIRNTARVLPARLTGKRETGGRVECLLLRKEIGNSERWWCLLKPGRKLPPGSCFGEPGEFVARVVSKSETAEYLVEIEPERTGETVELLAERVGSVPLPPYIHRDQNSRSGTLSISAVDRERYQTVFADQEHTVAVAAPTAGLHFTESMLGAIAGRGVKFVDVVLHVGLGTFRPIETEEVADHPIHREIIEVPPAARRLVDHQWKGRRIAVGTTSVRTMEHFANQEAAGLDSDDTFVGEADLFIHPPYSFRVIDGLITNFHLPRSTLLCLVASFLTPGSTDGVAWLKEIYAEAIREQYRFLSYGDAMLIL